MEGAKQESAAPGPISYGGSYMGDIFAVRKPGWVAVALTQESSEDGEERTD